jgi:hypothetical protein
VAVSGVIPLKHIPARSVHHRVTELQNEKNIPVRAHIRDGRDLWGKVVVLLLLVLLFIVRLLIRPAPRRSLCSFSCSCSRFVPPVRYADEMWSGTDSPAFLSGSMMYFPGKKRKEFEEMACFFLVIR